MLLLDMSTMNKRRITATIVGAGIGAALYFGSGTDRPSQQEFDLSSLGEPTIKLEVEHKASAGAVMWVTVWNLPLNLPDSQVAAHLVLGSQKIDKPMGDGALVPYPQLIVPLSNVQAYGTYGGPLPLPNPLPTVGGFWAQCWRKETFGWTGSNAVWVKFP